MIHSHFLENFVSLSYVVVATNEYFIIKIQMTQSISYITSVL